MGRTGQSWGKQVLNLRLVRMADGQPMGGGMCFLRDLLHILDALLCYLGFLWPIWDARRQCLFSDKIMNTVVLAGAERQGWRRKQAYALDGGDGQLGRLGGCGRPAPRRPPGPRRPGRCRWTRR